MQIHLELAILPQPNDETCGPTCLHAIYRYYEDDLSLDSVIEETTALDEGGTLAVLLGCHALKRGYSARMYTFNLQVFDPTWFVEPVSTEETEQRGSLKFRPSRADVAARLTEQIKVKDSPKLHTATHAYIEYLRLGGELRMQDLTASLIRKYLNQSTPILAGLSATYLYGCEREVGPNWDHDDIRGFPTGHFVVLCGYDKKRRTVRIADPYLPNPLTADHYYEVNIDRLVCAILLGVLTYDSNLTIIEPLDRASGR